MPALAMKVITGFSSILVTLALSMVVTPNWICSEWLLTATVRSPPRRWWKLSSAP